MATAGLPPLKITDVKAICTAPDGIRLVVVKITTSEPGLYGLGCATFTQRPLAVVTAVEEYLKPFLIGKDPDQIEDLWQSAFVSSYWRSGPVLNNALSGMDQALWDIKGKRAGMPLYQLFGGKVRKAAALYAHASGQDIPEVGDNVQKYVEQGYRYVRAQVAVPGMSTYGSGARGRDRTEVWEFTPYCRIVPKLFEHLRGRFGDSVELLHDVHERIPPIQAIGLARELEKYNLFFLEDALAPEDVEYFRLMRQQTSTPQAMGELFVNQSEYVIVVNHAYVFNMDFAIFSTSRTFLKLIESIKIAFVICARNVVIFACICISHRPVTLSARLFAHFLEVSFGKSHGHSFASNVSEDSISPIFVKISTINRASTLLMMYEF